MLLWKYFEFLKVGLQTFIPAPLFFGTASVSFQTRLVNENRLSSKWETEIFSISFDDSVFYHRNYSSSLVVGTGAALSATLSTILTCFARSIILRELYIMA